MAAPTFKVPTAFLTSPAFWAGLLHGAEVTVEEASPDYTVAHKIAAIVGSVLGDPDIHTPNAAAAKPLVQALADGARAAAPQVVPAVVPQKG